MAFINATLWNDLQMSNATNEKRFAELGLIDAFKASTPSVDYISPSAREALRTVSSLRGIEIPVIKDQTVVVNTTPGFTNIPSNLPESDKYEFVAYDVFSGFRHYPAANDNNMVDSDFQRQTVMNNVAYAMANTVEGILSTNLEARKTQQLAYTAQASEGTSTFTFSTVNDDLTISLDAQKDGMFYKLAGIMEANELPGSYRLVTSRGGLMISKAEYLKYGTSNEKDIQALGYLTPDRMHETGNLTPGSDRFVGYMMRDGAVGVYENFPWDFRNGTRIDGREWRVSDVELPYVKMRANIYTNAQATDATSLITAGTDSNLIMSHFEEMAIWLRFYVVYRYNSDLANRPNDIVKIIGATA